MSGYLVFTSSSSSHSNVFARGLEQVMDELQGQLVEDIGQGFMKKVKALAPGILR